MLGEARWIASTSAGSLHLAGTMLAGAAPVDPKLATDEVRAEVVGLGGDLDAVGVEPAEFFRHAIPLVARFDSPTQVADVALRKILGGRQTPGSTRQLARRLQALWAATRRANPDALAELELRSRPLRDAWEARGPGLLAALARLTDAELLVQRAEVILVQPATGGGGRAHPLYNAVSIEAVLANPHPELPEVTRLGWLWAQLHLDLPKYHEVWGRAAITRIGPLAVLPPLLAAADQVELVRFDRPLLAAALDAFAAPAVEVDVLFDWWETYRTSQSAFDVAAAALGHML